MPDLLPDFLFRPEPVIWLQRLIGLGHALPFRVLSLLGTTWGVLAAVGLALWVWGRRDAYAVAVGLAALVKLGLNQALSVPRPDDPRIVKYEHVRVDSFPSGHAATTALLWGLLYARGRVRLLVPVLLVLLVSLARLYLGVHYLVDVVAGALLGGALAALAAWLWPKAEDRLSRLPLGAWAALSAVAAAGTLAYLAFFAGRNPFVWSACGAVIGGALGAVIEYASVRYRPPSARAVVAAAAVGWAGLVPPLLVERLTGEERLALAAVMTGLGGLWTTLVAPCVLAATRPGGRRGHAATGATGVNGRPVSPPAAHSTGDSDGSGNP